MFLKANRRSKDGKTHTYYTINESTRVPGRVVQRTVLHLGELNTTQVEGWQKTIETIQEDGQRYQMRLFSDREGSAPRSADVVEVIMSSLELRRPRMFGAAWVGCKIWEELGLGEFWRQRLADVPGDVGWEKVVELLAVNRLCAPRSELSVHEKWYPQTAMDILLDCDARVAEKDRLYRCLDKVIEHKEELEKHLAQRWKDLFGARFDVLLYDLTSTYFEGAMEGVPMAKRGYSRDGRPDCKQIVIALIVTQEGFPLTYEIFDGNRRDVTTLDEMLEAVERKYGKANRVWVFDRGIVSEENLAILRQRGGNYLVGTIKQKLNAFGQQLLEGGWDEVKGKVQVKLIPTEDGTETYVLAKSLGRKEKEHAMRHRALRGLMRDLAVIQKSLHNQTLVDPDLLMERLGRLKERWPGMHRFVSMRISKSPKLDLRWELKRDVLEKAQARDGAYLLRTNLVGKTPQELWTQYIQLTEVEASFRALKSEIRIRPIWHWISRRISAHVMIAFLGYALWVGLKHRLRAIAQSMTPWQLLDQFGRIQLIEVWFDTRDGRRICLPRITQPEAVQRLLLAQLRWSLPQQPPPRIYNSSLKNVVET